MNGHDVTQGLLGLVISLLLYHLHSHSTIDRDLADMRAKVKTLWHHYTNNHEPR